MFHMPMSSPMMTTMFGFLPSCAYLLAVTTQIAPYPEQLPRAAATVPVRIVDSLMTHLRCLLICLRAEIWQFSRLNRRVAVNHPQAQIYSHE